MKSKPFEVGDRVICVDDVIKGWNGELDRSLVTLKEGEKSVVTNCFQGDRAPSWCVAVSGKHQVVYRSTRFKKASLSNDERMLLRKQELIKMAR